MDVIVINHPIMYDCMKDMLYPHQGCILQIVSLIGILNS